MALRPVKEPKLRAKLRLATLASVEAAMQTVHQTVYRSKGWPSRELEAANVVSGFLFPLLRHDRQKARDAMQGGSPFMVRRAKSRRRMSAK